MTPFSFVCGYLTSVKNFVHSSADWQDVFLWIWRKHKFSEISATCHNTIWCYSPAESNHTTVLLLCTVNLSSNTPHFPYTHSRQCCSNLQISSELASPMCVQCWDAV